MKPSGLLNHGDVVEIEIDGIGRIKNRMVFDNEILIIKRKIVCWGENRPCHSAGKVAFSRLPYSFSEGIQ
jgi:hypothetical protein